MNKYVLIDKTTGKYIRITNNDISLVETISESDKFVLPDIFILLFKLFCGFDLRKSKVTNIKVNMKSKQKF
jgi:hypothetical protein